MLARLGLVLCFALVADAKAMPPAYDTSYLPLAKMIVEHQLDSHGLEDALATFAADEGLTLEKGDLQKNGRTVLNESLRFPGDTFFHVTDFRRREEVEIVAYSHEPAPSWHPTWERLVRLLTAKFHTIEVQLRTR